MVTMAAFIYIYGIDLIMLYPLIYSIKIAINENQYLPLILVLLTMGLALVGFHMMLNLDNEKENN